MSKAEEFLKVKQRPKTGLTESAVDDVSYISSIADDDTEAYVKNLQSGEANIMVAVRSRPISKAETK
jgi:hypothetical protein